MTELTSEKQALSPRCALSADPKWLSPFQHNRGAFEGCTVGHLSLPRSCTEPRPSSPDPPCLQVGELKQLG